VKKNFSFEVNFSVREILDAEINAQRRESDDGTELFYKFILIRVDLKDNPQLDDN
jgi:hypothetical protein